jgi:membrane-associated phospholipid phosphatase
MLAIPRPCWSTCTGDRRFAGRSLTEIRDRVTHQRWSLLWSGVALLVAAVLLGMVARHRGIWFDHAVPSLARRLVSPGNPLVRALSSESGWPHGSYVTALLPVLLTMVVAAGELRRHGLRAVYQRWRWVLLTLAAIPVSYGLRVVFGRPGPDDPASSAEVVGAYPSGAALAVGLGWGLCIVVAGAYRPRWRPWLIATAGVVLVLHVLARAVTDKHWASDIVGSYLLAASAFALAGLAARPSKA